MLRCALKIAVKKSVFESMMKQSNGLLEIFVNEFDQKESI